MGTAMIFQQMLVIFLLILIGYWACRKELLTESVTRAISALVVNVTNPALLISSAMEQDVGVTHRDILEMALVSAGVYAVLLILGELLSRFFGGRGEERKFYYVMLVYANVGFIGIPVVLAVLGPEGLLYLVIFNLFFNFLFYTHGLHVLTAGKDSGKEKITWRTFVNVGTVSGVIALLLFWFEVSLPEVLSSTLSYAGGATTFLSMLVLGASLSRMRLRSLFSNIRLDFFCLAKMLALPVLLGLVLRELVPDEKMFCTALLLIAMPAGNLPLMTAQEHHLKADTLARGIVITTLLSIVTVSLTAAAVL